MFSVLQVSSGFAKHMGNQKISITCIKSASIVNLSIPNTPQGSIVQIRHRSPEEVEDIIVPNPNEVILYVFNSVEITPDYLSKWNTYFSFEIENLPDDQALVQSFSLRAPPFSC